MLGDTLKRLREAKGLTLVQLATKAGITYAYLSMLRTRARRNPSLAAFRRLAKALGVAVPELLDKGGKRMWCFECAMKRGKTVWMDRVELKDGKGVMYSQPRCP